MPLTSELKILALSVVLGFLHIVLASHAASLQRGYRWTASARDDTPAPLTGVAGRLERASRNFLETFPLFAASVLIAHAARVHNSLTEWGVQLYLWGRIVYAVLYALGVPLIRSLVWNVATAGIFMILAALIWR